MSTTRRRYRRDFVSAGDRAARFRGGAASSDVAALQDAWPGVAGGPAARQSIVVRRSRAGLVTVACASAMWAQELDARRDLLNDKLSRAVPAVEVTGLRFVVGDHVIPATLESRRPVGTVPTAHERDRAREAMAEVTDPVLRDLLERAAAGQMATARTRARPARPGPAGRRRTPGG